MRLGVRDAQLAVYLASSEADIENRWTRIAMHERQTLSVLIETVDPDELTSFVIGLRGSIDNHLRL